MCLWVLHTLTDTVSHTVDTAFWSVHFMVSQISLVGSFDVILGLGTRVAVISMVVSTVHWVWSVYLADYHFTRGTYWCFLVTGTICIFALVFGLWSWHCPHIMSIAALVIIALWWCERFHGGGHDFTLVIMCVLCLWCGGLGALPVVSTLTCYGLWTHFQDTDTWVWGGVVFFAKRGQGPGSGSRSWEQPRVRGKFASKTGLHVDGSVDSVGGNTVPKVQGGNGSEGGTTGTNAPGGSVSAIDMGTDVVNITMVMYPASGHVFDGIFVIMNKNNPVFLEPGKTFQIQTPTGVVFIARRPDSFSIYDSQSTQKELSTLHTKCHVKKRHWAHT